FTAVPSIGRHWGISRRHRRVGPNGRANTPASRPPSRSLCHDILFLLWASDQPSNAAASAAAGHLVGRRHHADESTDRILGGRTSWSGPARTPASRDGIGGARRVLHCDRRLRCWPCATTWAAFGRLCSLSSSARSNSHPRG